FTTEHFRQMLEFNFLPAAPVRVGQEWPTAADIPISGRGRFRFDTTAKFAGWQQHGQTNGTRIDLHGKRVSSDKAPPPGGAPPPDTMSGTLWIDPSLGFPIGTILDAQIYFPDDTLNRKQGTNSVPAAKNFKSVRQNVTITLLDAVALQSQE